MRTINCFLWKSGGREWWGEDLGYSLVCFSPWQEFWASTDLAFGLHVENSSFHHCLREIFTGFQHFHFQDLLGVILENSSCRRRKKVWPPWHKFDLPQDISIMAYFFLVSADFFAGQLLTCALTIGGSGFTGFCLSGLGPKGRPCHHHLKLLVPYSLSSPI